MIEFLQAEALYFICLEKRKASLGPTHIDTHTVACVLAGVWERLPDKCLQAEVLYRECVEWSRAALGEAHEETLQLLLRYSMVCYRVQEYWLALQAQVSE